MQRVNLVNRRFILLMFFCFWSFICVASNTPVQAATPSIQEQIDQAKPGETIFIKPGQYNEAVVIDKSIQVKGQGQVDIISTDQPTITILADQVQLENLSLTMKKKKHAAPALLMRSHHNVVQQLNIDTNSFGIQLDGAHNNKLESVNIVGDDTTPIKLRKHGILLQQSHYNTIQHATITSVQDGIYLEKSRQNTLQYNDVTHSRYGYHLMFTEKTIVQQNRASNNLNGLMVMGANKTTIQENVLTNHQQHGQALGLLVFDTTEAVISNNQIQQNRIGILVENAQNNHFLHNTIQANYIGIQLKKARKNTIAQNAFMSNLAQGQALESSKNNTNGNYWNDHVGLDVTGDHQSNLTYTVNPFWLKITEDLPSLQLLFQSPGIHFLEDMIHVPKSEQLIDSAPLMNHPLMMKQAHNTQKTSTIFLSVTLLLVSIGMMYIGGKTYEKI